MGFEVLCDMSPIKINSKKLINRYVPWFFGYKVYSAMKRAPNLATQLCEVFNMKISLKYFVVRCT